MLFVALEPSLFHSAPKLQYVYAQRPSVPPNLHIADLKHRFAAFLGELRTKLGLPDKYRYLFTKTGEPVERLATVIRGDYTFFISNLPSMDIPGEKAQTYRKLIEEKFKSAVGH